MEHAPTPRSSAITAARWTYGLIGVVVAASLAIQLVLLFTGGADANSGESGEGVPLGIRLWRFISFFTIDSNIVVLVVSLLLFANPLRRGPIWEAVRLNALLAITITGLVYAVILAPMLHLTGWAQVATIGLHYISPWATVLAWLVFGPRPRFTWLTIPWAFLLPIVWLIYTFIAGAFTHWYPYPFLNVNNLGLWPAIVNACLVLALALVLALIFKLLDAKLPSLIQPHEKD